jgi:hypothetical protein
MLMHKRKELGLGDHRALSIYPDALKKEPIFQRGMM